MPESCQGAHVNQRTARATRQIASVRACLLNRDAGVFLAIRFAAEKASSSTECSPGNKASCSACARTRSTSTSRNARDATGDGAHRSEEVARTVVVVSGDLRDAGPLEDLVGLVLRPLHLHTVKLVSVFEAGMAIATGLGARMVVAAEIELPKGRRMRGSQKKTVLSPNVVGWLSTLFFTYQVSRKTHRGRCDNL